MLPSTWLTKPMLVKPNSQTTHSLCLWSWRGLRKHILDYFLKICSPFTFCSFRWDFIPSLFSNTWLCSTNHLLYCFHGQLMNAFLSHFIEKKKTIRKGLPHVPMNTSPPLPLPSLLFLWIRFTIIIPKTNPFPTYILFSISFLYLKTLFCKCPQLFWIKKFSLLDYSHNSRTCCSRSEPKPEEISRSLSMRKT